MKLLCVVSSLGLCLNFIPTAAFVPSSRGVYRTQNIERTTPTNQSRLYVATEAIITANVFAIDALKVAAAASTLRGKTVVVKYGGNAMTSTELKDKFCEDVAALQQLGIRMVVVHGGGPQINAMLDKVGVESRFEGGLRVSSKEVVDVAEMVLCGSVNKEISSKICSKGGRAIGLSGRDDSLLQIVSILVFFFDTLQ